MRKLTTTLCLTLAVLLGSAGLSWSADFQKGLTAAQSGDFATALREWEPLAEQGDASAQFSLGAMYEKGKGVPQDYKTAVKWYRLAAEQGYASAQSILGWMYDAAVFCCSVLSRKCFAEDPEDEEAEVDYQISWIKNDDGSIVAEIRPS